MDGIIIINKEKDYTSRDVVNKIGKILGTKKVGHTGTLDPMATGVLAICIGKATKLVDIITSEEKEYIAGVKLGIKTDTLDTTGKIIEKQNKQITKEEIIKILNNMVGYYDQEVPIYSAVKIKGKKLYEYARNNIDVELPKRQVHIKKLELISDITLEEETINFKIKCLVSKGTYIRSLIRDIAQNLGTIGVMSSLCRTKQGEFKIEKSYTLKDIENNNFNIIDINTFLKDIYKIQVDGKFKKDIINGKILKNIHNKDILFIDKDNNALAIYKIYEKDNTKIKPYKTFF